MHPRLAALAALAVAVAALAAAPTTPAHAQQAPGATGLPALAPVDPGELAVVRPFLARGFVVLPREIDLGPAASRATIYLAVRAPAATVARVVATPEEYPALLPMLREVAVLSRHQRRTAFRCRASVGPFDATVLASLHAISPTRVDFAIAQSEFGPGLARWELIPDGPDATIVALTVWTDASQASWTVRNLAGTSGYLGTAVDVPVATLLGLAVKRRAEILAGAHLPLRPAAAVSAAPATAPVAPGPWVALSRRVHPVIVTLDADGALVQTTAVAWTPAPPERFFHRMLDAPAFGGFWPWVHPAGPYVRTPASVRFGAALGAPLAPADGALLSTIEPGGRVVRLEGVAGALGRERHRFELYQDAGGGTYLLYTAPPGLAHASWFHQRLMERDPWLAIGMNTYWHVVSARLAASGLL